MIVYADLMLLLNFAVDFLLLLGTNRLMGSPGATLRCALAALFGSVYAVLCLCSPNGFLSNTFWRVIVLGSMAVIAFGFKTSAISKGTVFLLLSMALGGIAMGLDRKGFVSLVSAAAALFMLCVFGLRHMTFPKEKIPVEIHYRKKVWKLYALHDTGNSLRDPISGQQVLILSADVAREIMGLTAHELNTPIQTVQQQLHPVLRLIPYRTVGQSGGMLLAAQMDQVLVGGQKAGRLVAFAPQILDSQSTYQALAGGIL